MAPTESGRRMISLYRSILRAHRTHLRPGLRGFGDDYVAYEFRQHRTAKPEFLPMFEEQWRSYLKMILETNNSEVPDSPNIEADLSDAQKAQLKKLGDSIKAL